MLGPKDLAEMVDAREASAVHCEFCGVKYTVSPEDVERVFLNTITAQS